jgi:hypothetical protein
VIPDLKTQKFVNRFNRFGIAGRDADLCAASLFQLPEEFAHE